MAYIKNDQKLDTFHKGDAEVIKNLNHMEEGIAAGGGGTSYTAGAGIEITSNVISVNETVRNGAALGATAIQQHQDISGKQDVIADLSTIRQGATLGATAIQPNDNISKLTNDAGYLTTHQSLSEYRKSADQDVIDATKQDKLTAGTNITIENNVISAAGNTFDDKTIVKGTDDKYQTAIGGYKELVPAQTTELFIDTKGTGLPTYINEGKYEAGWDYNITIASLVGTATTATVQPKITVLGTVFNNSVVLTKSQSIPAIWESSDLTIGGNVYKFKIYDGYLGANQGGLGLISNDHSLDISGSVMESCAIVTVPATEVYHPIDNRFLKLANSLAIDETSALKVNTEVIQAKLTAGTNISIDSNNAISADAQSITLPSGQTSGTITDAEVALLNNSLTYVVYNNKHFHLSKVTQGTREILLTFTCAVEGGTDFILIGAIGKAQEYRNIAFQPLAQYISLSGTIADGTWHDGGTLSDAQVDILLASELNYIWLNDMHRLDFRYKDDFNNLATYSAQDGEKSHLIEITLSDKTWRYKHITDAPNDDGTYVFKCVVSGGVKTYSWVRE